MGVKVAVTTVSPGTRPRHHASQAHAMGGFCLCFNNIAIAATAGAGAWVAVVDFDVHHGNGTEEIFAADSSVLFISSHQFPFIPAPAR